MKITYKKSVKAQVDEAIAYSKQIKQPIEYIALSKDEYIQFLEEIPPANRVILTLPDRQYMGVHIRLTY